MGELTEDVTYRCKCGSEIEWRVTTMAAYESGVVKTYYRNLAASLVRFASVSKSGEFRIRFATMNKATVALSRKPRSRIVIVSDDRKATFGQLDLDTGEYVAVKALDGLPELLAEADNSLRNAAIRYGLLTKRCSFCGRHLSDRRSTRVGYGRVCAEHHKLPWGGPIKLEDVKAGPTPTPTPTSTQRDLNEGFHYKCACGAEIEWRMTFGILLNVVRVKAAAA